MSRERVSPEPVVDRVLDRARTFAVVGASNRPMRPSYGVMQALLAYGYEVIPITPVVGQVLGRRTYPDLASVPADVAIDVVDLFRRSEVVGTHVDEAIERGVDAVWFQFGVVDAAAQARAAAHGIEVITGRCPAIELPRRGRGRAT